MASGGFAACFESTSRERSGRAHRASEQPSSPPPAPLESHGINSQSVLSLPPSLLYNAFDVCLFLLNLLYFDEAVNYERAELP